MKTSSSRRADRLAGLSPDEPYRALVSPTSTKARKEAAFLARVDFDRAVDVAHASREMVIPALDLAALSAEWGEYGTKPVWKRGTFTAPVDASWDWYERLRDEALRRFIVGLAKLGWELVADNQHRPRVAPGLYPAHDLRDGIALLDQREFQVGAWFTFPKAKPVTIEIPQHLADARVIRR